MDEVDATALLVSANPAARAEGPRVRIGACRVEADLDRLVLPDREVAVEPKAMAVLMYLAHHPGRVVSAGELIEAVWHGRPMGDNPVYRCIAHLRRALGDDPRAPRYIATVPTKGYRLITTVAPVETRSPPVPGVQIGEVPAALRQTPTDASPAYDNGISVRLVFLLLFSLLLLAVVALLDG